MTRPVRVIAFGTFDPAHAGHEFFLQQAKALGDYLVVVIARDTSIRARKHREPFEGEEARLATIAAFGVVDEAILGNDTADQYRLLSELDFDVVAMGYDQEPSSDTVREELNNRGKFGVKVVRLPALRPDTYKSTIIREASTKGA